MVGHAHANDTADVLVEGAFVIPRDSGSASVYLIINNRGDTLVTLQRITSAGGDAMLFSGRGRPMPNGMQIPGHAELYMQPGGVHALLFLEELTGGSTVELELTLTGGRSARVDATVLERDALIPDHRDYHVD